MVQFSKKEQIEAYQKAENIFYIKFPFSQNLVTKFSFPINKLDAKINVQFLT
jgi:hypothetical protein